MRIRRPALAAAEVVREHGAHAPVDAAVKLEEIRVLGQRWRKLDEARHPVHVVAFVDIAQGLVVDELDSVPVGKVDGFSSDISYDSFTALFGRDSS